ncbi:MAG: hypothetical protein A2Z72_05870 [Omnitrophica bacterium RBG_13_46_9]|nr:MAG: hypothetical protein A2Z72_05870 [Omnitrophica bacterium RBG_13_46_9]
MFIFYRLVSRITGVYAVLSETGIGGIEKTGGAILGISRSAIIIGLVVTCLLLLPLRFVESGVKSSRTGMFFVDINLRIASMAIRLLHKDNNNTWYRMALRKLTSEKKPYLLNSFNLKDKSRFFNDEY